MKMVIDEELAEKEFERWVEFSEIEIDENDDDTQKNFLSAKKIIVKAFQKGRLVLEDNLEDKKLIYEISNHSPAGYCGEKITISEPRAMAYAGRKQKTNDSDSILGMISGTTGKDIGWIKQLAIVDFKVLMAITALFFM